MPFFFLIRFISSIANLFVEINNFIALNLEVKNYFPQPFAEYARSETDNREKFQMYVTGTVGVSIFFPFDVYISR